MDPGLRFWLRYVDDHGGLTEPATDGTLVVLPPAVAAEFDLPDELMVTSDPDIAREDGTVLLATGHPVLIRAGDATLTSGDPGGVSRPAPPTRGPPGGGPRGRPRHRTPMGRNAPPPVSPTTPRWGRGRAPAPLPPPTGPSCSRSGPRAPGGGVPGGCWRSTRSPRPAT